ncbi:MAG: copper homeostasis protein CutC [Bacteroidia bacterium]|nr:copper homeostasis protein CutC [Bacteroidia bacterium]MCF8427931.1 copper homeostasis protein CutC [Bacteroidia bacterium]
MLVQLEIACFDIDSAITAEKAGAQRVEICVNKTADGLTPPLEMVQKLSQHIKIPMRIMIRPRAGNFQYSDDEFIEMQNQIKEFKNLKIEGFVVGILDENKKLDTFRNKQLIDLAYPLPCTLHKAFDEIENQIEALEMAVEIGFNCILSSGGKQNCMEGSEMLSQLLEAAKNKITIMPGGGIRSTNLKELKQQIPSQWFHSSAIIENGLGADFNEVKNLIQALQ